MHAVSRSLSLSVNHTNKQTNERINKQTNKHIKTDEHIDVIARLSSVCCTAGKWKGAIDVAVKTMKPGTMSPEKFLDEAEVMKTLRHPRLVTLYAVCTQDEPIYIVTELMHGGSLLTLLRNSQKNRQNIVTDVLIDMAAQVRPVLRCCVLHFVFHAFLLLYHTIILSTLIGWRLFPS